MRSGRPIIAQADPTAFLRLRFHRSTCNTMAVSPASKPTVAGASKRPTGKRPANKGPASQRQAPQPRQGKEKSTQAESVD